MHVMIPSVKKPDPEQMLTTEMAAQALAVKPRTVVDMVVKGLLHPIKYQRPGVGGGPVSLFDPAEVQSLFEQRAAAKTEVLAPNALGPLMRGSGAIVRVAPEPEPEGGSDRLAAARAGRETFLTISEAHQYIGLPEAHLLRLVQSGELYSVKSGAWYVRRRDLDAL